MDCFGMTVLAAAEVRLSQQRLTPVSISIGH